MVKSNVWWGWLKKKMKWHWWRWGQWPKQRDRRHKVTRHIVRSNWSCDQSQMLPTTSTRWPVLCCCCKPSGLDVRPKKHSEHYSVWQNPKDCSMVDNVTLLGTKGEWGGGPAFDTFSPGKQDRSTSCVTRAHLKKDPSAAAPLQCWSMCRQISHAGVSRNTFKKSSQHRSQWVFGSTSIL